jgi:hypothetical protein
MLNIIIGIECTNERIKLTDVEVLTFYKDKMTLGRRLPPVPQLKCNGSPHKCHEYGPNAVQCTNKGFDGIEVQWECKAEMDKRYKFGKLRVTCEGYEHEHDPFILAGSCGVSS